MPSSSQFSDADEGLVLGIDTCGPRGSIALGLITPDGIEILGQTELEGRSYSSTLLAALSDLLDQHHIALGHIGYIVVVNGPGSFTGVRIGLSAVKGLAEAAKIPVVAVSRLEVLGYKAGVAAAALDAHRHEVFLRFSENESESRDLLAGTDELARILPAPKQIAVCDDAAVGLLTPTWPETAVVRVDAPLAADALEFAAIRAKAKDFVDLALLDGHYLRRSDAEIFGETTAAQGQRA